MTKMETLDEGSQLHGNDTVLLLEPPPPPPQPGNSTDHLIDVSELPDDARFAYVMYIIFTMICLFTTFVFIWITVKVVRKVGRTDMVIPLMLLMLQLSAFSKCFFDFHCVDTIITSLLFAAGFIGFVLFFIY